MTIDLSRHETNLRRCAICKIDLKGRFVYIDDKIESILGLSKEELFGKNFLDFLDESSSRIIENLLSQRNHYETFYDATELTILDSSNETVYSRAIVSLNFIAGNPVNFQIILDPIENIHLPINNDISDDRYKKFIEELILINNYSDYKRILQVISNFSLVPQLSLSIYRDGKLEPRSSYSSDLSKDFISCGIPEPSDVHYDCVKNKEEYSCIDERSVQAVIEKYGSAVDEFITTVDFNDGNEYLLRLIFNENTPAPQLRDSIDKARTAIALASRFLSHINSSDPEEAASFDIRFTIGFLDSLSIPAMLIDSKGDIVGYNPCLMKLFEQNSLNGTYVRLFDGVAKYNQDGMVNKIIDHVTSPYNENGDDLFEQPIYLSKTVIKKLQVLKISDCESDLSSIFVFIPYKESVSSSAMLVQQYEKWHSVLKFMKDALQLSSSSAEEITHKFYNSLSNTENQLINDFNRFNCNLFNSVDRIEQTLDQTISDKSPETVDINIIANTILDQARRDYPSSEINFEFDDLLKLKTKKNILVTILTQIISNAVKFNTRKKVKIKIDAQISQDTYYLDITDNGPGISPKNQADIFKLNFEPSRLKKQGNQGIGLALCKILVESLQGEIFLTSTQGEGTTVSLKLPSV